MTDMPSTPPPQGTPGIPPTGSSTPPTPVTGDFGATGPMASAPYAGPPATQDDKTMGMLAHLLGIFTWFVGPLIIWMIKKDQSPFVNDQGKEALNFQITMAICGIAIGIIGALTCVGNLLFLPLFIVNLVFCLMGTMKAKDGIAYRYPFALRLIK